jgi:alcohol dehydrogenase class IV
MDLSNFSFPTAIAFGPGARKEVANAPAGAGPEAAADRDRQGRSPPCPLLAEFQSHLKDLPVASSPACSAIPTAAQVEWPRALRVPGAPATASIGFGGGAALDVAKVVGIAATTKATSIEYAWDHPQVRAIDQPLPYFVALPTTAGTGSEWALGRVSEDATHLKRVVFSPKILASKVFADPS